MSPELAGGFFTTSTTWEVQLYRDLSMDTFLYIFSFIPTSPNYICLQEEPWKQDGDRGPP